MNPKDFQLQLTALIRDRPLHATWAIGLVGNNSSAYIARSVRSRTDFTLLLQFKDLLDLQKILDFHLGTKPILLSYTLLHCYDVGWTHSYERHSKIGWALSPRFVPSRCFLLLIVCSGRIVLHSLLLLVLF